MLLTSEDARKFLNCSEATLYRMLRRGEIKAFWATAGSSARSRFAGTRAIRSGRTVAGCPTRVTDTKEVTASAIVRDPEAAEGSDLTPWATESLKRLLDQLEANIAARAAGQQEPYPVPQTTRRR